jgi:long-chain acyl-CoA synthetase
VETIDSLIIARCRVAGPRVALRYKAAGSWQDFTYATLLQQLEGVAAGLRQYGLQPGEHCALLAPASPWWVAAYLGVLRAGGIVIPVDKELKAAELRHILYDSRTKLVFSEELYLDTLLELAPDLPKLERIVLLQPTSSEESQTPKLVASLAALTDAWHALVQDRNIPPEEAHRLEELARSVYQAIVSPGGRRKGDRIADFLAPTQSQRAKWQKSGRLLQLQQLQASGKSPPPPASHRNGDIAVILYTSGTTGQSKGAMLSHANVVSNIRAACDHFRLDDSITTLSFLPINHVFEQVCGILLPLSLGGTVSFAESIKKLGENLAEVRPSFLLGVPAVYRMILDRIHRSLAANLFSRWLFSNPLTRGLVAGKVRRKVGAGTIFVSGGAALDPAIARGFQQLGLTLYQGYGITETSPVIAAERPGQSRPGTVGVPLAGVEVLIHRPNEEGIGEIWVKGPNVMQGYYNNPRATAEVLHDGWYSTGDLGALDPSGMLRICGRVKNLIVTPNGKNVYPEEVENELLHSPFIAEAMVYGHKVGPAEEVHALIFPNQEALDDYRQKNGLPPLNQPEIEELIRREVLGAGRRLADYKRIRRFTLRDDEFPKTTTRKIKRFAVEADITAGE